MIKFFHYLIFLCILTISFFVGEKATSAEGYKKVSFKFSTRYDYIIFRCAKQYTIHPNLIKAVILRESEFNPYAVGRYGEIGLMQITRDAVRDWAKAHNRKIPSRSALFSPSLNIEIGVWYLARAKNYWKKYSSQYLILALCEYNAGRKGTKRKVAICKRGKIVIYNRRLHRYISSVITYYNQFNAYASRD